MPEDEHRIARWMELSSRERQLRDVNSFEQGVVLSIDAEQAQTTVSRNDKKDGTAWVETNGTDARL